MTPEQFLSWIREVAATAEGKNHLARACGVKVPYIHEVVNGKRPPSERIARGLGLRRVVTYEPIPGSDSAVEG